MEPGSTCLSESTLVSLLERGLPGEQRAEIEAHLDACASCRRLVVDLTAVLTGSLAAAENHTTHPAWPSDHGPALELGAMVGRFVVFGVIGRGGMGTVYTAYDPELDRNIALKLLHPRARARTVDHARARILAEAQAMARISHPGVVAVYEVGTSRDRVFAAMELVEGTTLRAWITAQPRSWREVVAVFLLAGDGLAAAHAAGVVHRDFKPENVLLGRDGRVKVGDFGLSSLSPAGDGAVAGTPGYLPVEALRGEAVDHRADQFAFCVALSEALHGRRPFAARTPDDLAAEVRRGPVFDRQTRDVPKQLDQIVRRGLAFEPEDRFASMRELLAAVRRTTSRRSAVRAAAAVVGAAVVLGAVAVVTVELAREPAPAADASACERGPEAEIASAWSPALRASLTQRLAGAPSLGDWLYELDGFAARWIRDYRSACTSPHGTQIVAKRACLLGERDRVAGVLTQLLTLPRSIELPVQPSEEMPRVEACDGESPVAPATLPADPARRAKILALHAKLSGSWLSATEQMPSLLAEMPGLVAEAEALGWDRILIEAHYAFGLAADRSATRWELARDQYQRAIQLALRAHDYQSEADIWEKRLWSEYHAASEPANPADVASLIEQAYAAVHHAGDAPVVLARIKSVEAHLLWQAGHVHDDALAILATARPLALSGRFFVNAMQIASTMAELLADRDRPGDLDAGWQLLDDTLRAVTATGVSEVRLLRDIADSQFNAAFRVNAFLRGDLAVAHAWDDREGPPKPPAGALAVHGRVVDRHGDPVAGATVVAWSGILEGDATRAYLRVPGVASGGVDHTGNPPPAYQRAGFDADVATTDAGGGFTVRAAPGGGILAELGDRRSPPRPIGDGAIVLQLEPTRTIGGRVTSDDEVLSGIMISAHYQLGPTLAWRCTAPVGRSHDYHLGGLPAGPATLRLDDWLREGVHKVDAGPVRDGAEPQWLVGPDLDVIVRGGAAVTPWVYVLRGHPTATTTADLDRLVDRAADATVMPAFVVGAGGRTAEAMRYYQRGDRHRVVLGNAPGQVTVCVAEAEPTAPAMCQTIEIPRTTPVVRDGHGIYPAMPVIFPR
jgi:tRNA A-37 threonylcarbamoyl transferase component Bud32